MEQGSDGTPLLEGSSTHQLVRGEGGPGAPLLPLQRDARLGLQVGVLVAVQVLVFNCNSVDLTGFTGSYLTLKGS